MDATRTTGRALLLALVAIAALPFFGLQSEPASAQAQSPIASTALQYVGTHGGQCWTFMKNVVREATGREIGFNYRTGYFDAGAIEVSASDATSGDIIQIADDSNTSPWASYPGLHTAIVLENLGGGRFDAVDSNQNWDEMVRLRPNYDPYAAAARYGLDVHIYRVPGGSSGSVDTTVAVTTGATDSRSWAAGSSAVVAADPGCLNLRSSAALGASIVDCLSTGTAVSVIGEPVTASGYTWVNVQTPSGSGWVATTYLTQTEPAAAVAVTESAPAAEPEAAAPAPAAVADAGVVAAAAPTGDIWYTDMSPGCLRVRDTSGTGGNILDCLPGNTKVTLVESVERVESDGYTWVLANSPGRPQGWIAAEFLIR